MTLGLSKDPEMPKTITEIQLFVASPGDVVKERDLLAGIVEELNRNWSSTLGIHLRLLRWEIDVHPAFGTDPQAIINQQIGEDYDIFVGILWGRFGTPTPRAESGTLEEFERAVNRRRSGSQYPEIMIYFKDEPIAPTKIDTDQLSKIQAFRAELPEIGALYANFSDDSGFENALRANLSAVARKFVGHKIAPNQPAGGHLQAADQEHDFGILDYMESYQARMSDMTSTMHSITDATERIGDDFRRRTSEVGAFMQSESRGDIKAAKRLVKRAAEDMNAYGRNLASQVPLLSIARDEAFTSLTKALALYGEFDETDPDQINEVNTSLTGFGAALRIARKGLAGFRLTIASMPRMTSDLNHAKKHLLRELDDMDAEVERTENACASVKASVDRMLAMNDGKS